MSTEEGRQSTVGSAYSNTGLVTYEAAAADTCARRSFDHSVLECGLTIALGHASPAHPAGLYAAPGDSWICGQAIRARPWNQRRSVRGEAESGSPILLVRTDARQLLSQSSRLAKARSSELYFSSDPGMSL